MFPVMEAMLLREAKDIHNRNVEEMAKYPALVELWGEMVGDGKS